MDTMQDIKCDNEINREVTAEDAYSTSMSVHYIPPIN
jgi:hypothetical protein